MSIYSYSIDELKKKDININIEFDQDMIDEHNNILGEDVKIINIKASLVAKVDKKSHLIFISGNVKAELKLRCVRELNLFNQKFDFNFNEEYSYTKEDEISLTGDIMPIYIDGGMIDMAHVVFEELVIELPNYPVNSQLDDNQTLVEEVEEVKKSNPFEILKKLKEK